MTEFLRLFSDGSDRIFGIVSGKSETDFRTVCVLFFLYVLLKKI